MVDVAAITSSTTTTTNLVNMPTKEPLMVRMTQATTLAQFQKTPKKLKAAINLAEVATIVGDVVAVASSPEVRAITIVVVSKVKTKKVVSLTTEVVEEAEADTANITTSKRSRLQLREITIRRKRRKILLLRVATTMRIL